MKLSLKLLRSRVTIAYNCQITKNLHFYGTNSSDVLRPYKENILRHCLGGLFWCHEWNRFETFGVWQFLTHFHGVQKQPKCKRLKANGSPTWNTNLTPSRNILHLWALFTGQIRVHLGIYGGLRFQSSACNPLIATYASPTTPPQIQIQNLH